MNFVKILIISSLVLLRSNAMAQQNSNTDTTRRYLSRLVNSKDEDDKALLITKLYELLQSPKEEDWDMAANFFYQMKRGNTYDSIHQAATIKFPMGITVRNAAVDAIYKQKDALEKEKMYKALIKKYPSKNIGNNRIQYDYVCYSIAYAYAETGNIKKALEFANMIETGTWKGEGWAGLAGRLKELGYLKEAAVLYERARANSYKYMTDKNNYSAFAAMGYRAYAAPLAEIYVVQKRYKEAFPMVKEAHDSAKTVRGSLNAAYAKVLMGLGKDQEAFDIIDEAIKAGQASQSLKENLKILYPKVKGSLAGYDEYMEVLNRQLLEKIRKDMARQIISLPAANFTMKDVDGNTVSLADLKGKTVILDFWATWCGPCKASFPSMKLAMERYKADPDVKFLFIHTWEKAPDATASAKKYMTEHNYPFEVLMDLKNEDGINPVMSSYKVEGIPTKFVIDGKGNIRFRFTGFSGGEDAAVEEVSAMIELARKS